MDLKNYQQRALEKKLNSIIGEYPIIMINGPRQVGKTTLLNFFTKSKQNDIHYVTLGNVFLRMQAKEDPELFLRTHEPPLVIDEFQYAKELLPYLKIKVDEQKKNVMFHHSEDIGTMYYLTGSQVFQTMEDVCESLAGRIAILDLYGFSTREISGLEDSPFVPDIELLKRRVPVKRESVMQLFERILNGSYPELILKNVTDRELFYQTYIRTYIERDIRELLNVKDELKFIKFISSIAARTGQEYNALDIARDIEIDSKTVDAWMSILSNTHLVYLLQPYSNNNVQKVIKRPKIYFMDTGLACFLTGYVTAETLEKSAYSGAIFENYVVSEIIKSYTNNGIDARKRLYYYRDTTGKEIDLLILHNQVIFPVEIKKSANPGVKAIKNFDAAHQFGLEVGTGSVICMSENFYAIDESNYYVPIEYI